MSDKRNAPSSKPTGVAETQPHPHRNSPQPLHTNAFKPIAIKTSSLSITPQKPTSPTLSARPNRRHPPPSAGRESTDNTWSAVDESRQGAKGHDESKAEGSSEVDTAGLDIDMQPIPLENGEMPQSKHDHALKSVSSDHSEDAKTLAGWEGEVASNDVKPIDEEKGLGVRTSVVRSSKRQSRGGKRQTLLSRYLPWDYSTESADVRSGRVNRIRKRRVFMRADPKAYFSNERTTYSWMYLHILTLSFALSLYAFPQASGQKSPPTHIAATIASGVALILVLATAAQFRKRQQKLTQLHKEGQEKSAAVFDESVHRFPTIVTVFVVLVMIINIVCIWSTPTHRMKNRTSFSN